MLIMTALPSTLIL